MTVADSDRDGASGRVIMMPVTVARTWSLSLSQGHGPTRGRTSMIINTIYFNKTTGVRLE